MTRISAVFNIDFSVMPKNKYVNVFSPFQAKYHINLKNFRILSDLRNIFRIFVGKIRN